jgi:lipopolysaccharide transport system ATP-binding protein
MKHPEGDVLVRVEGLSKKFCRNLKRSLFYGGTDIVKGFLGMEKSSSLRHDEFWAIDNVNFELRRGECLGLIGHNGAGKSTLLKMLNGLIRPDKGRIEMNGKVAALIELGAGFSPFLTGRENVYNNGAVLGFSKAEIDQKFDEIVEFAELKDFIDTPVQNYSSGMKVRLGFAVAAQMEPDILLVDEVLAVGDMGFVLKCFNRMDKLLQNTAMIFVSHAMPQVARMSTKILILDKGRTDIYSSDIGEAINKFYSKFGGQISNFTQNNRADLIQVIVSARNKDFRSGADDIMLNAYEEVTFKVKIKSHVSIQEPFVYLAFYDKEQRNFAEVSNFSDCRDSKPIEEGESREFVIKFDKLAFAQGIYSVSIAFSERQQGKREVFFRYQSALYFQVDNHHHGWAPLQLTPQWNVLNS